MEDDDAPPELVDVSEQPLAAKSTTIQDTPVQQRVPITLVTGMARQVEEGQQLANGVYRISGRRKDNAAQLHFDGEAWQEDCRDHE